MADSGRSEELSPKQRAAVMALVNSPSIAEAAKAAGVSERALRRWRHDPAFRAALRAAERETFADGLRLLISQQRGNLARILLLASKGSSEGVQLRAALAIEAALAKRFELSELEDLHQRLDDLEAEVAKADDPHAGATT